MRLIEALLARGDLVSNEAAVALHRRNVLLEDILDFIGADEVVSQQFKYRQAALCARIRTILGR